MNNYHLYNIEKFLVDYVQTVKDIVGLNLYVVDDNLIRVVSTGALNILRGIPFTKNQVTYKVMAQKKPLYLYNPKESELCQGCEIKELGNCMEEHTLYYPIVIDDYAVGVIALFAVTDKEKQKLKSKLSDFERFLSQMVETIKLKLKETTNVHRLETLMANVSDSIIVTNIDDTVLFSNLPQLEGKSGMNLRKIFDPADLDRLNEIGYDHPIMINDEYGLGRFSLSRAIINPNERHIEKMYLLKSVEEEGKAAKRIAYNELDFIGSSDSSMLTRDMISKAADYDFNVLILGESGTGKGVIAEAIHKQSVRKDKPFIEVNCSAIPSNLIESELFGYEAGAFSGASKNGKPGKFELANGGTIFLDEIGEMDIALQPKLLKVLDDKRVSRLGGVESKKLDIRVIAATNKNVQELVGKKLFREDLYYRLAVMVIENEPLRSKTEDLIPLATHFINKYNRKYNKSIKGLSQQVVKAFMQYDWPGNIRELENAIEYAVAVEEGKKISTQSLARRILSNNPLVVSTSLDDIKKNRMMELFNIHGHTAQGKQKVAESLGISLSTLYRYMKKFKIS
ncbi:sigma-54 interaction domain-containing protein [Bacillus sp. FJAT-52991]|uniref:Sigma 54-interacting transcriptional regulator n=1 Tax=Bacillus kandeliae TaxID=3129297 RepID=A0ABZ2N5X6_9BACI